MEFALVSIPLFLVVFGIIDFGILFETRLSLDSGTRASARFGAVQAGALSNAASAPANATPAPVTPPPITHTSWALGALTWSSPAAGHQEAASCCFWNSSMMALARWAGISS